jgi:hypothetical protein
LTHRISSYCFLIDTAQHTGRQRPPNSTEVSGGNNIKFLTKLICLLLSLCPDDFSLEFVPKHLSLVMVYRGSYFFSVTSP